MTPRYNRRTIASLLAMGMILLIAQTGWAQGVRVPMAVAASRTSGTTAQGFRVGARGMRQVTSGTQVVRLTRQSPDAPQVAQVTSLDNPGKKAEVLYESRSTSQSARQLVGEAARVAIVKPPLGEGLRFNFVNAQLDSVLDYMSKAAGFVINRENQVPGRINVISERPLNPDEAVQVLNSVLFQRGYTIVRSGKLLRIVPIDQVRYNSFVPIFKGNNPAEIPQTDEVVTWIIPVRYANAQQIIQNLDPLLPAYAVLSADQTSNAVMLTASKTDIHRMAEIVQALDTAISGISTLKVYVLNHADATDMANLITNLFKPAQTTGQNGGGPGGGFGGFAAMMGGRGGRGGGGGGGAASDSLARAAAQRVTAVPDIRTNAVIISAADELLPTIDQLVKEIDIQTEQMAEIRVFRLLNSDATAMADTINNVFTPKSSTTGNNNQGGGGGRMMRLMGMGGMGGMGGGGGSTNGSSVSARQNQQSLVYAYPEMRTNSVVVNADKDNMEQNIAPMIAQLDKDTARAKKVFTYKLNYADPEKTATILQSMVGDTTRGNSSINALRNWNGGIFSSQNTGYSPTQSRASSTNGTRSGSSGGGSIPSTNSLF